MLYKEPGTPRDPCPGSGVFKTSTQEEEEEGGGMKVKRGSAGGEDGREEEGKVRGGLRSRRECRRWRSL